MTTLIAIDDLPNWSTGQRGIPNALARSALFNVSNLRSAGPRAYFQLAEVAATKGIRLVYTGAELRQDDEDVFLQVLHLAREQRLGENIHFTANSMLKALHWTVNSGSYERLTICMHRMKATALQLTVDRPDGTRIAYTGSLIGEFMTKEQITGDPLTAWVVSLPKNIVLLFDPQAYSLINWSTRLELPPLAKWLHSFYATHREPFPHKVETLHKLTASKVKEVRKFRYELSAALAVLVENNFLLSARIDTKSGLVHVERAQDKRLVE